MAKKMTRCPQGHLYEADLYSTCPHCGVPDLDVGKTRGHGKEGAGRPQGGVARTRPPGGGPAGNGPGITRAYYPEKTGEPQFDPVVGWLVCIEGKERGKDYKIKAEWNFIGRDTDMDICIQGDDRISRHRHAKLNFDPESAEFSILPGEAGGNIYLNDRNVLEANRLKAGDRIKVGGTKLLFVPLCGETFNWETAASPEVPPKEPPQREEQRQEPGGPDTWEYKDKSEW